MNLKIFFAFISFCLFNSATVWSQIPEWSLRGGINLSSIGGLDAQNAQIKLGTHLGFFGSLPITNIYRLESGLSYSLKGARTKDDENRYTTNFHYLDLPILARVNVYPNLDLLGGPQVSFLFASRTITEEGGRRIKENSNDAYNRLDLGVHLGAAYDLSNYITVGLGYDWGLIPHDKSGAYKTFNRVFKIIVSYNLD